MSSSLFEGSEADTLPAQFGADCFSLSPRLLYWCFFFYTRYSYDDYHRDNDYY